MGLHRMERVDGQLTLPMYRVRQLTAIRYPEQKLTREQSLRGMTVDRE